MPQMETDREHLHRAVADALTDNRGASMGELAASAGVSRATLHRVYGSRDGLNVEVYEWLLDQCDAAFDAADVDDGPVLHGFDQLIERSYPLAQSYWLLIATPSLEKVPTLISRIDAQDSRLDQFFKRGQAEGVFRHDLPPRWLAYTLGAQVMSIWYLVNDGYAAERDATSLIRRVLLEGDLPPGRG